MVGGARRNVGVATPFSQIHAEFHSQTRLAGSVKRTKMRMEAAAQARPCSSAQLCPAVPARFSSTTTGL
ncbi:hypothetical protein DV515_00016109 [Chloebia gouldiae]|uniref:Uncharacterized protein n=1 Tax=Chloebia gouldiae TaxID=44316 RepID=A0A3L8RT78_CHLGU|nr:hypothetical protein DV515_00016109 [Chloebia gouldiae]